MKDVTKKTQATLSEQFNDMMISHVAKEISILRAAYEIPNIEKDEQKFQNIKNMIFLEALEMEYQFQQFQLKFKQMENK